MAVRINVAIESSLRRFGIVRKVRRSQAIYIWEEVVGSTAAKISSAVTCKDGVLFVEVKNSVWAQELSLMKRDVIRRLNLRLGRGTIKDIRFKATGAILRKAKVAYSKPRVRNAPLCQRQALSRREVERIEELASDIRDPAVKEAFVNFVITAKETRSLRDSISRG